MKCSVELSLKYCRIGTVFLGFAILVVGLHSHYRSSWVSLHADAEDIEDLRKASKLHELCEVKYFYGNCPDIFMEQFYVAVITINFIFSLLGIVTYCLWYRGSVEFHPLKWLDLAYHVVSAAFLLAAATLYIASAIKIREFSGGVDLPIRNFKHEEKFVAGGLTILQMCIHVAIAALIGNCRRDLGEQDTSVNMATIVNGMVTA